MQEMFYKRLCNMFLKGVVKTVARPGFLIFFAVLHLSVSLSAAGFPPLGRLGIEQGLSNNSVKAIYRDHHGFLWFGTYDGLNRYDGYEFKIFRNRLNDSASLPHNYIYAITEDLQNNLWVSTGQGICIYNNLTAKFLPAYYRPYNTQRKEKINANATVMKTTNRGIVLMGTNGSGLLIKGNDAGIASQLPVRIRGRETTDYKVRAITVDENNKVWVLVNGVGLCLYDETGKTLRLVTTEIREGNCAEADLQGHLWIGSQNGLQQYSIARNSVVKTITEGEHQLTSAIVVALAHEKDGRLWIGTEGGGVDIYNTNTASFDYLLPGESQNALTSESVYAVYIDPELRKWIGTLKGGINLIDPQKFRFQTISHDPFNANSLINNFAACFYEDPERRLWIGTDGGGLSVWDRSQTTFLNYRHIAGNDGSLRNNMINSIVADYTGTVWLATFGGGIARFDRSGSRFVHYACVNSNTGEENRNIWRLLEDHDRQLWATTFSNGKLYRYNRSLDKFEMFSAELNDLVALKEDKAGILWAGNSHQLVKIDRAGKNHLLYEIGKPVRAIFEDGAGNFWLGTEGGGLLLFDRVNGRIAHRYSDADGLCNNAVLNILEDEKGNLWLSTFNGLSRFDRQSKTFRNFYQSDGLQSNQFLYNSALRLHSGELVFGGIKGFTMFSPGSLQPGNRRATILLTGIQVNSQPVSLGDRYTKEANGDQIAALQIPYDEAALWVGFTALEYSAPDKISYAYYLDGWDKAWNYSGSVRTATYTHLNEGNYVLRIKCTNAEGSWNSGEIRLKLTVLPPWYRSWWAYTVYALLLAAAVYFFLRYKARQARLEYEVKLGRLNAEKERADRERTQAEYDREKAERETERVINEREKEINEKRLLFFTDVSHEFRTPLTLIINPVKDLLGKENDENNNVLHVVYRNARRLLSLVDQLLLFRKADTEADRLKISKLDFLAVCKDVYLSFLQQAKAKKICYEFNVPEQSIEICADKEKIEIVLFNLLSNALKYTPEGGKVVFGVSDSNDTVDVFVIDNGPGIPDEVGEKLFDRFYRVPAAEGLVKSGFGIGLYLAKHFVEKHKGSLTYTSKVGGGTTFHVTLPKANEGFDHSVLQQKAGDLSEILHELITEPPLREEHNRLDELVSERQSILLVDDDAQLRHYAAQLFAAKYVVYQAESGEEGLKLAQQNTPDIIISDVSMTGMSGIELTKAVKETPALSHIPVILLTGASAHETKLKGVELGADDYIIKPFEKEFLLAKVEAVLRNRNLLQKYFYNEITLQQNTLKVSPEYKDFLDQCIRIVEKHIDDDQFSIQALATEIGMSHSSLYKRVKSISGLTVNAFIRFIRLRKAAELFITTDYNVNQVSLEVGINDTKYFRSQFNKLFGMNPSAYIKKFRKPFNQSFTLSDKVTRPKEK